MVESIRDRFLKVFRREPVDRVVLQPRIGFWYSGNHVHLGKNDKNHQRYDPTIPDELFGLDLLEVHEALGLGIRYPSAIGLPMFHVSFKRDSGIKTRVKVDKETGDRLMITETPVGTLTERHRQGHKDYVVEKMVKTIEDLEPLKYVISHTEFSFNEAAFNLAEEVFSETGLGVAQAYYQRSPFMRCIINYIGFERTVILFARHRKVMEEFLGFMEEKDDPMYEVLVECPMKVFNFGENIDGNLVSPRYFKRYLVPYWNRRVRQLHDAGKFCHAHFDGALKNLLPLVGLTEFDGIEAATPLPQGDVTEEEIKKGLGDKILLDGMPATLFMKEFPVAALEKNVHTLLELFGQDLILGVSDELPPNGQIGRFRVVQRIIDEFKPPRN